jgi:outer membrane cobalamin receptor
MGQITDTAIRQWQEAAGIQPASGTRAETLERLSQLAFELIKAIELERSGIRDGDGSWHGSDVIGGIVSAIATAEREDVRAWTHENRPEPEIREGL